MGISRLTWKEIDSWLNVRAKIGEPELKDYEINLVRQMSEAYSSEYSLSTDKSHPAPYAPDTIGESIDRTAVSNKLSSILGSFGKMTEPRYEVEDN